jgi:hypothetical protein
MYYIPQDIWKYIKSFTFDYKEYVKYNKKKLIEEYINKTKFWTYKKTSTGYWYYQRLLDDCCFKQYGSFNSLKKTKELYNYMNIEPFEEDDDIIYDIPDENYKIPIFWTDEIKGVHPYFLYNIKNRLKNNCNKQ